jgi:hypothetical protein
MTAIARPDVALELSRLKNFQRDTVEYVFDRMYEASSPARRFLVADEVGLGKTMVARGLVAKAIDHLWDTVKRIDVVYICSNGSIARQNISRLNVSGAKDASLPSRITLLPTVVRGLEERKVNFISLTPQTSFDLRSSLGTYEERALLYWLLPDDWRPSAIASQNILQGAAERDAFRRRVGEVDCQQIDAHLQAAFRQQLGKHPELRERFLEAADRFSTWRQNLPEDDRLLQRELVGTLRLELAVSCLGALQPDLIILDEFQRFKHLLDGTDQASALAKELFNFGDARVLLLSATPYKMYTIAEEVENDDHFRDFLQTVSFLQADTEKTKAFKSSLDAYRDGLFALGTSAAATLDVAKQAVQDELRNVMVRTERLAASGDRNGMLAEVPSSVALTADDVSTYVAYARVAAHLDHPDITEYWKSAPFLFNFMDDYQLKATFQNAAAKPKLASPIRDVLASCPRALLNWHDVEQYRALDPANARLRHLIADVIDSGAWRFLWLPPALTYYESSGAFAEAARGATKRLIFSSWQVVPKVVAAVLSYEAERHMFGERPNTPEERDRFRPLLRFGRGEGRLTGMPILALLYPSITLAEVGDPLAILREWTEGTKPSVEQMVARVADRLRPMLAELAAAATEGGAADQAWYWAAPALLDVTFHGDAARRWLAQPNLSSLWREAGDVASLDEDEGTDAWADHVVELVRAASGQLRLGPQPSDLAGVLARAAIGAPGVVCLRALARMCNHHDALHDSVIRNNAGWIAWGFRTLFNLPEVSAMLRRETPEERYWQSALDYCVDGGLQAVMDEYLHVAQENEGVTHRPYREAARTVAKRAAAALQLRTATLGVDAISLNDGGIQLSDKRMRARFAARFGAQQTDEGASAVRADDVRAAFNSPFWPFVLCSTSVGQEGLDFHLYCHAVVHWNLPSNPVDLEQREGRVHRYKGHAIRRNAATLYGEAALRSDVADPWTEVFAGAAADRPEGESDLTPFWVLPLEGGASIERHVPALPLSRDIQRADALRRTLTVYRMAFGQNRQDDLVAYLVSRFPPDEIAGLSERLKIDLAPKRSTQSTAVPLPRSREVDRHEDAEFESQPAVSLRLTLERATSLLDAYAARRVTLQRAGIENYRELLDRFVALKKS